ncbi:MAG: 5'-methylthioadenosine/adenosylhomocysteine nucleosidase [Clostridia bacterium]
MENYIGIIVATIEELEAVKEIMSELEKETIYDLDFYKGRINSNNYILVKCGVGKVNAARTTQILTDSFSLQYIVNVGVAGGLSSNLQIGDIVIGEKLVQHDFDITAFGHEKGYITDTGKIFKSDKVLVEKFRKIKIDDIKIITGTIASGDIFVQDIKMKEKIRAKFNCDCVEMEGAAIGQVCFLNKVPFIVVRSISDIPNGNNYMEYDEFVKLAAKNCAKVIEQI